MCTVASVLHRRALSSCKVFSEWFNVFGLVLLHSFPQKMFGNSMPASDGRLELVG